jgi:hypothetical protein
VVTANASNASTCAQTKDWLDPNYVPGGEKKKGWNPFGR